MHLGPILTNGKARVGENAVVHINTAFVAQERNGGCPIIGNNVVVYVGAVVFGGIRIAYNFVIGANVPFNKDVCEKDVAVAGVPVKIISNVGCSKWNKDAILNGRPNSGN